MTKIFVKSVNSSDLPYIKKMITNKRREYQMNLFISILSREIIIQAFNLMNKKYICSM